MSLFIVSPSLFYEMTENLMAFIVLVKLLNTLTQKLKRCNMQNFA